MTQLKGLVLNRSQRLMIGAGLAALASVAAALVPATASLASGSTGTSYYVSTSGSDQNSGTSTNAPWQSLAKVDAATFQPGDTIHFESGDQWVGQLWAKGSGSVSAPITIDSYGTGAKPQIQGQGSAGDAVELLNQQYWVIRNLDVSNEVPATQTPGANLGDFRGIGVHGNNGTVLHNITIDSVYVHDVTGQINWVGGSASNDTPGVNWGTGWDRSKNTGGIIVNASVANIAAPGTATTYDGLTIENSRVENTSFSGISTKQYSGDAPGAVSTGWGQRATATDSRFTPFTNVIIQNNYITQAGTAFGGDGVYITGVRGGTVQGNVIDQVGVSGVESNMTDNITVQYNEIMGTHYAQHSADANGLDPDIGTTNQYFQYNYLHDNADGILLCACGSPQFGSATIRYNVVANSTNRNIYFSQVSGSTAQVYNNTFYNKIAPNMTSGSIKGTVTMTNNIFASERSDTAFVSASALKYNNNGYTSNETKIPSSETKAVTVSDARFVNPDPTGPYGSADGTQLATADAYALQPGSGFIDSALAITGNGGVDYAGNPVPNGTATDIGAFEYRTPAGQNTESVAGTITSQYGSAVAGASVAVSVGGTNYTATSDSSGFYVISGVPFATDAPLMATAPDYETYQSTVTIADGTFTRQNFTMTATSTTGTFTGTVIDERGNPVSNAQVTVSENGSTVATPTSGNDGSFTAQNVPVGSGYSFVASALGYSGIARSGFSLSPTQTVNIGGLYLKSQSTETITSETFDNLPTGSLANGTDGWKVVSTGNTVNVAQVPSATDKSGYLNRTNSQGGTDGTNLARVYSTPLTGLVTIQAQIMRNDSSGGYFGLPYVYNAGGSPAVSVAFAHGQIEAYEGGTLKTLTTYNLNQWYTVTLTIDTVNQSFDMDLDGQPMITNASFRTSMPSIGKIAWYANGGEVGSVYINNVTVSRD
ncbi:beta strand repeat-containing protein [Leifsonia sp. 2MCAF36]|uniref:beta strand repeat-containing protein n=1 Tax=Leifsonia sp. 2MCAF36 TaxID=3232988 RepID=UPI003F9CDA6E